MAALSGLLPRPVDGVRGRLAPDAVAAWIRPESVYYLPRTSVLALENTHNGAGGTVTPREAMTRSSLSQSSTGSASTSTAHASGTPPRRSA